VASTVGVLGMVQVGEIVQGEWILRGGLVWDGASGTIGAECHRGSQSGGLSEGVGLAVLIAW